jgi:DNA-3-methyladenine glycosylase
MFGAAGHLYVYFTYGMHYCCNIVTGEKGYGAGVLIRAVKPIIGEDIMTKNRKGRGGRELSNGPGKVCQALDVDKRLSGHDLTLAPFRLIPASLIDKSSIDQTVRIGISKGKETPWRFLLRGL